MEGFLAAGVGGLLLSGVGLFHGWTYGKAYVEKLKTARDVVANGGDTDTGFGYLSGTLSSPRDSIRDYASISAHIYEVSTVRTLTEVFNQKRSAKYDAHRLLLSSTRYNVSLFIGQWDVSQFLESFVVSDMEEKFNPTVPADQKVSKTTTINVANKNKSAETPLGEIERQVVGTVVITQGVKLGDFYTIFGNAINSNTLTPCNQYGALVFPNQLPAQVIADAESSLSFRNLTWGAIGCVSAVTTVVAGYALKMSRD
jgi:hypothetical protein